MSWVRVPPEVAFSLKKDCCLGCRFMVLCCFVCCLVSCSCTCVYCMYTFLKFLLYSRNVFSCILPPTTTFTYTMYNMYIHVTCYNIIHTCTMYIMYMYIVHIHVYLYIHALLLYMYIYYAMYMHVHVQVYIHVHVPVCPLHTVYP